MINAPAPFVPLVNQAAAGTGLPPQIVDAQANMEAGFNPKATSPTGAQGWLQFEPGTWKSLGVPGSPYDPKAATQGYIKLMSSLLRQFHGNVRNALAAYNAGPSNIGAGLGYADTILKNSGHGPGTNAMPGRTTTYTPYTNTGTYSTPGTTKTMGGGLDTQALALAVLERQAAKPIDTSGKVTAGASPLKDYVAGAASGKFQLPTYQVTTPGASGTVSATGSLRTTGLAPIAGQGTNVNPLGHPDWKIGRTDMGVDAHAAAGTPIEAMNDSVVKEIIPNWYSGQPLVLMQLTAGPDAGKYWYVSEQIAQLPHRGQRIQRGHTVAVYAPTGTGIEIGWGSPTSNARTAAGASGSANVPGHANTPEGLNFLHNVLHR